MHKREHAIIFLIEQISQDKYVKCLSLSRLPACVRNASQSGAQETPQLQLSVTSGRTAPARCTNDRTRVGTPGEPPPTRAPRAETHTHGRDDGATDFQLIPPPSIDALGAPASPDRPSRRPT